MNKPLISIITINYNNLQGLEKTMSSIFEQTWREFEYVIIDGGSTDGSKEYIESHNDKMDYWISEKDSGIYNAMNKGIKKATGEYLLFLNSGDHFLNRSSLENNIALIKDFDLIYFHLNVIDGTKVFIKKYPEKLSFTYFILDSLPHPSTFIRSSLFKRIGFYEENLRIVSDWKFFLEAICKFNASYLQVDTILSSFYLDGISSNASNKELIQIEKDQVLQASFSAYIADYNRFIELERNQHNFKKSKKYMLLVKLNLINKLK